MRPAQVVGLLVVEHERLEQRLLGVGTPHAAHPAGLRQGVDPVVATDAVAPAPRDPHLVGRDPGDAEHQPRLGGLRHGDRAVGGEHRHVALQPGEVLSDQLVAVRRRNDERVAAGQQPAHLRARRRREVGQRDRPVLAVGLPQRDDVPALPQHVEVRGVVPLAAQRGAQPQLGVVAGSGVDVEPQRHRWRHLDGGEPLPGHQRHPDVDRAPQQRDLVGPEPTEREERVGPEVHLPAGGPVRGQQVVEHRDLVGRVAAPVEVRRVGPRDAGADPVVAGAALQRAEPQRPPRRRRGGQRGRPAAVAGRPPGRLQVDLERERLVGGVAGALGPVVELVEQRGELPLPAPGGGRRGAGVLVADRDDQRQHVLAALVDRAAAPAEDPRALAVDAHADVDDVRRTGRPAHRAPDVEVAVGVDLVDAGEHVAVADVVPGAVERRGAVAAPEVLVGEQRGEVDHGAEPTVGHRHPGPASGCDQGVDSR